MLGCAASLSSRSSGASAFASDRTLRVASEASHWMGASHRLLLQCCFACTSHRLLRIACCYNTAALALCTACCSNVASIRHGCFASSDAALLLRLRFASPVARMQIPTLSRRSNERSRKLLWFTGLWTVRPLTSVICKDDMYTCIHIYITYMGLNDFTHSPGGLSKTELELHQQLQF